MFQGFTTRARLQAALEVWQATGFVEHPPGVPRPKARRPAGHVQLMCSSLTLIVLRLYLLGLIDLIACSSLEIDVRLLAGEFGCWG